MIARKVAVIGLDAADFGFLDPWILAGDLPQLASFRSAGASGILASTLPPVSAPAWATFMTGLRPENHGLFDFVMEDPLSGRPTLARADLIRGRKLWEYASDAGRRGLVVNVPISWPPAPFRGSLVTGMLTPEGKPFTHPPELGASILAEFPGYRFDYDPDLIRDLPALRIQLGDMAAQGAALMKSLMGKQEWDLFVGVFTTTDRVKHQFWDQRETVVREHYRAIDRLVGEVAAAAGPDTLVLVISDHGFRSVPAKFYPNRWLQERGLLSVRRRRAAVPPGGELAGAEEQAEIRKVQDFLAPTAPAEGLFARLRGALGISGELEVDPTRTKATLYSIETGGFQVNLRGRSPEGTVEPGSEYEEVRDTLLGELRGLRFPDSDEPLFDLVERRETVYPGPMVAWAPDIVTRSKGNRVAIARDLDPGRWLRVNRHDRGGHSPDGILLARGPGVRHGARLEGLSLADVMPTLLWALGVPVPEGLDGRVRTEIFEESVVAAHPVRTGAAAPGGAAPASEPFDAAEEEELRKTLEGLGYI